MENQAKVKTPRSSLRTVKNLTHDVKHVSFAVPECQKSISESASNNGKSFLLKRPKKTEQVKNIAPELKKAKINQENVESVSITIEQNDISPELKTIERKISTLLNDSQNIAMNIAHRIEKSVNQSSFLEQLNNHGKFLQEEMKNIHNQKNRLVKLMLKEFTKLEKETAQLTKNNSINEQLNRNLLSFEFDQDVDQKEINSQVMFLENLNKIDENLNSMFKLLS